MTEWHPLYSNGMVCLSVSFDGAGPVLYRVECKGRANMVMVANGRDTLDHIKASALHATVLAPL